MFTCAQGNALWEWDAWSPSFGHGGIYHEGAADTQWGRAWAYWKREVRGVVMQASAARNVCHLPQAPCVS